VSNLYNKLINFCDYCFEHKELILLQIFKTNDKLYQRVEALDYEYENDYIIFKADNQEEFLIMLDTTTTYIRLKPNISSEHIEFPREKEWGKKIIFEIIDKIHGHDIIFSIGVENEGFLQDYIREYIA